MTPRQLCDTDASTTPTLRDLTLRTPPNWTAIWFFAFLGALHLSIAIPAFSHRRWEGFLSLAFGLLFIGVALACWLVCCELTIEQRAQRLRLRSGYRRVCIERFIPFQSVHGVRLMLLPGNGSWIELLCDNEDIQVPPTDVPRQQALCLAMMMNVRLIKVFTDGVAEQAERLESVPSPERT